MHDLPLKKPNSNFNVMKRRGSRELKRGVVETGCRDRKKKKKDSFPHRIEDKDR